MTKVGDLYQIFCDLHVNHLEAAYKICHYTRKNMNFNPGRLGFDSKYNEINGRLFEYQYKVMDQ